MHGDVPFLWGEFVRFTPDYDPNLDCASQRFKVLVIEVVEMTAG